jgi:flagellar biosynthetic protein FliP
MMNLSRRQSVLVALAVAMLLAPPALAMAQTATSVGPGLELPGGLGSPEQWTSRDGMTSAIQVMLVLTVLSLAPALLIMTTSFIRIVVVLGILRQALGTQQLPPGQVITSLALFMTFLIMSPVWKQSYEHGIQPYVQGHVNPQTGKPVTLEEAWTAGVDPLRRFMGDQLNRLDNHDDVYLFLRYMSEVQTSPGGQTPEYVYYGATGDQKLVPLQALLPAFMLSELKTAFLIGFQLYLPFVIIDIVVASVTISMGMLMLPPVLISLPFKLLLFVLVDGWHLVVGTLMESFQVFT